MYTIISADECKLGIIYFLILLLFYINYYNLFTPLIEGNIVSDISSIGGKVNNIADTAGKLPGQITGIGDKISGAVTGIAGTIATKVQEAEQRVEAKLTGVVNVAIGNVMGIVNKAIKDILNLEAQIAAIPGMIIGKIKRFGENLVGLISDSVVSPFLTLFGAIGNLFTQIGEIAMQVINKITSLPSCSALYVYQSIFGIFDAIYKYFIPSFLQKFISTIYAYTLKIPLEYISKWIGLTAWWDKCFNFNVDEQVHSITDGFNKVGPEFKSKFGHMNFNDLIKGL